MIDKIAQNNLKAKPTFTQIGPTYLTFSVEIKLHLLCGALKYTSLPVSVVYFILYLQAFSISKWF